MSVLKRAAFLVDAGPKYGLGHLRRCLALRSELVDHGVKSTLYCEEVVDGLFDPETWVRSGYVDWLTVLRDSVIKHGPFDAVVVDSYHLNESQMDDLRSLARVLVQMYDFGQPYREADIVVNPSQIEPPGAGPAMYLVGPKYAVLGRGFRDVPLRGCSMETQRILVTLGGAASRKLIECVLMVLKRTLKVYVGTKIPLLPLTLRVVVGPFAAPIPYDSEVTASFLPVTLQFVSNPDMYYEMCSADLAISAGGQTLFELLAMGIPIVALQVAENQEGNLMLFQRMNAIALGGVVGVSGWERQFSEAVLRLMSDASLRRRLSNTGRQLVDGRGAVRVANEILAAIDR